MGRGAGDVRPRPRSVDEQTLDPAVLHSTNGPMIRPNRDHEQRIAAAKHAMAARIHTLPVWTSATLIPAHTPLAMANPAAYVRYVSTSSHVKDTPYPARAFWNSGSAHTSEAISEALHSMAADISTTGTARRAAGTSTDRGSYSRTRLDRLRFGYHRRFNIRSADDAAACRTELHLRFQWGAASGAVPFIHTDARRPP